MSRAPKITNRERAERVASWVRIARLPNGDGLTPLQRFEGRLAAMQRCGFPAPPCVVETARAVLALDEPPPPPETLAWTREDEEDFAAFLAADLPAETPAWEAAP